MMQEPKRTQTERLQALCEKHLGEHYESPEWRAAMEGEDWDQHWPIVDAEGLLTGDVIGDEGGDEYASVGNVAMVCISDLPKAEQRRIIRERAAGSWDGYAEGV